MTRDTHSTKVIALVAFMMVLSVAVVPFSGSQGVVSAQQSTTEDFVEGFEDYSTGETAPGNWEGGTVNGTYSMNGSKSLLVSGANEYAETSTIVDSHDFSLETYIRPVNENYSEIKITDGVDAYTAQLRPRTGGFEISVTQGGSREDWTTPGIDGGVSAGNWYKFEFESDGSTVSGTLTNVTSGQTRSASISAAADFTGQVAVAGSESGSDALFDSIQVAPFGELPAEPYEPITGRVTDQNDSPIDGATVEFRNVSTDSETTTQTTSGGDFSVAVESGRYEISISAEGYQTLTDTRDLSPGDELGTFQLSPQQLDLQFNRFVEPGDSTPYTVEFTDGNGTTTDVTSDVTMNSSNTSIATVDTAEVEIVGSSGVNGTSVITANYTVNNTSYTATRTVTVATKTVDNLEILPGTWRFSALFEDITIQVILVGIGAAIIATRAASSWAGLGAMELVLIIGWFGGWVPIGIAMLGLFTALFIGLNLAANIDYSVRR